MTNSITMNKQSGGTFLGVVIGVVVGLALALAVAVFMSKVPLPFMSKTQARAPENEATETKKNKDWDPNAGLAGKNVLQAPLPNAAPSGVDANTTADPLGDLVKSKNDNAPATPVVAIAPKALAPPPFAAAGDPFTYFVQVGAFRATEDAEQRRAQISLLGLQARVTEHEQAGRTIYRVRLGPFDKKEDAEKAKEKLDTNSLETALVRVQK